MLDLARSPWPLPLGGLAARRSLLSVDNLVAAVDTVLRAPAPLRRPLIVADPEPLTVPEMVAALRAGLGRKPGLVPVPPRLLGRRCRLAGRERGYERLAGVARRRARQRSCAWAGSQPVATRDGLAALARAALAPGA